MPRSTRKASYPIGVGKGSYSRRGKWLTTPERVVEPLAVYNVGGGPPVPPLPRPWNKRLVIILPGDPLAEISPNINPSPTHGRASMMKKARLVKKWKLAMEEIWEREGRAVFNVPVLITFDIRRGRKMDPDNCLAGLKNVIDGLTVKARKRRLDVDDGLIPDDSAIWVAYAPVQQLTGQIHGNHPCVFVIVEPQTPENMGKLPDLKQADTKDACLKGSKAKNEKSPMKKSPTGTKSSKQARD